MSKPKIIFLMGPSASGKTALAVKLTEKLPCDIISVDSAMVYKNMRIGTAMPDEDTLKNAPHRLINFVDPAAPYSAGQFYEEALREIKEIISHKRIPLLVGGTMMYFHILLNGLADLPKGDKKIRDELSQRAKNEGYPALHQTLMLVDPETAKRLHPNDGQRILRALEVFYASGEPISQLHLNTQKPLSDYQVIQLAITPENRKVLHERIEKRFDDMLAHGLIDEVKALHERGDLTLALPSMRSVGYFEVWQYLEHQLTYDEMREKAIAATRQLAKRQLTWLRRMQEVFWFDSESPRLAELVLEYLTNQH